MRKGGIIFLYMIFAYVLVMTGCGRQGTAIPENADEQDNIAEETSVEKAAELTTENPVYYTYRETVIPDAWSSLPDPAEDSYYRGVSTGSCMQKAELLYTGMERVRVENSA